MKERLKFLRTKLKLSVRSFSERINLSPSAVSNMESGFRSITERTISDICREFNVNIEWFKTGKGEIFTDPLAQFPNISSETADMIRKINSLKPEDKEIIDSMMNALCKKNSKKIKKKKK